LYQVFLKLYEQNRGLLDEILSLENSGSKALARVTLPYIQGLVLRQQVYLVTNVLGGDTQALTQSQNLWIIGRDSRRVNLPIQDKRLSRRHAAIRYANKQFYLVDLGNGEPIRRCTSLKDGDRIRLGSVSFSFFICDFMHSPPQLSPEVPNARDMPQLSQTPAHAQGHDEEEVTTNIQPPAPKVSDGPNPIEETFMFLRKQP
jgi:pSer/pThr/pTyr-binding forkhead associated (FHA) protein